MSIRRFITLAFLSVLLQVAPSVNASVYRIVSGRKATTVEFPYQAAIEKSGYHWCGGSIISRMYILSASHCVKSYESYSPIPTNVLLIRVGNDRALTGGMIHQIEEVIPHENYNEEMDMDQYDIALIKLVEPLKYGIRVKPVALSTQTPNKGEMGWVTGFGKQEVMRRAAKAGRYLMAVELPVVSLSECREILPNVADDMICAGFKTGSRDSCMGDSGGPFVVDSKVVGIVAWGIGCGREGLPGAYTNVAYYKDWITNKVGKTEEPEDPEM